MWQEMADWFEDTHVQLLTDNSADADNPHEFEKKVQAITMDLCSVEYKFNSRNIMVLEDKDSTKARSGLSPDMGDAGALTFAEPVAEYYHEGAGDHDDGRHKKTGY
jgi:hypothetical protein